jgi:hypothetical protein
MAVASSAMIRAGEISRVCAVAANTEAHKRIAQPKIRHAKEAIEFMPAAPDFSDSNLTWSLSLFFSQSERRIGP